MNKKKESSIEKMRMTIELADNGIILRNPECEDEVTLAITQDLVDDVGHLLEYKAIGKKIYDWLMDVVLEKHASELIITGFDIEIEAKCTGRSMYDE